MARGVPFRLGAPEPGRLPLWLEGNGRRLYDELLASASPNGG